MKYTIAIALFALPFYLVLSAMPAKATTRAQCSVLSTVAKSAGLEYQMNLSMPEVRQDLLKAYSEDDGTVGRGDQFVINYHMWLLTQLYTGNIYMPQVLEVFPKMAMKQVKE